MILPVNKILRRENMIIRHGEPFSLRLHRTDDIMRRIYIYLTLKNTSGRIGRKLIPDNRVLSKGCGCKAQRSDRSNDNFMIHIPKLFYDYTLSENKFVSGVIYSPELRLARSVAFYMMNDISEFALESAEQHSVSGIVGKERLRLLYPWSGDGSGLGIAHCLKIALLSPCRPPNPASFFRK